MVLCNPFIFWLKAYLVTFTCNYICNPFINVSWRPTWLMCSTACETWAQHEIRGLILARSDSFTLIPGAPSNSSTHRWWPWFPVDGVNRLFGDVNRLFGGVLEVLEVLEVCNGSFRGVNMLIMGNNRLIMGVNRLFTWFPAACSGVSPFWLVSFTFTYHVERVYLGCLEGV